MEDTYTTVPHDSSLHCFTDKESDPQDNSLQSVRGKDTSAQESVLHRFTSKASDYALAFSMYVLYPAILVVVCIDVIGRNFFATPLSWAIEGSGLFLIGGIFLAASRVELDRGHILLDILYANYSRRQQLVCDIITRFVAAIWMFGATWRSSIEIYTSFILDESGTDFRYPFWPMRAIMTLGFLLVALALVCNIISCIRQLRKEGKAS